MNNEHSLRMRSVLRASEIRDDVSGRDYIYYYDTCRDTFIIFFPAARGTGVIFTSIHLLNLEQFILWTIK